ncbi:aromatic ring-opening dioxygenase LigB subunit, putative [Talaromyces stipitatus ATCC 10500]|uniref:Aromatic ring-opening dioxygenase LigB subunit, putative n=1 Tax=Talaromyces stipitatus (strain ATCC 10500 / CBS 375.48 / QM 6759 / NRRL 1006) TaxID=441959 RepID=B8MST0_TALSN|nr:aromatic ring-opening dioxygenase LigB subunit, putative [Talaromyces stipitatus ATCC 10500]XP_002488266.1 aromatic ring-opening dioxygenase LigB subunit, putative [Talaromyces stipitatus ATCC 10500]EED12611.1 aromatic ring-opening dioxygenase LigB subunit, putative [Talaromyces stipitatus ATCC 10500]EED12612.1 aromatic ring-opening dioxygenase LigB subunit, putative [Talaromyces stipitatus ATCC 10500]
MTSSKRTPVYFLGIGGPNFIGDTKHPAYFKLAEVGQEITQKVQPKAVVVFSAHWQGGPNTIQINTAEKTDLIYDFYGFPPHYYEVEYPNRGSREVAEKVMERLSAKGIDVEPVKRGLDHGVWAGFIAAFDPKKNPLDVPIVEVSIFGSEDSDQHYRVGEALQSLRDEGILIMGAGMVVHNLRDYRSIMNTNKVMPYVYTFDEVLKEAVTVAAKDRRSALSTLMKQPLARQANPTFEHILPLHVAAGAAGEDVGERLWTLPEKSLSWAQYRFGSVC